jgi:hypothetical protein
LVILLEEEIGLRSGALALQRTAIAAAVREDALCLLLQLELLGLDLAKFLSLGINL